MLLEAAAHCLALALAEQNDIDVGNTTWEGEDMGGLCASFYAKDSESECPPPIERGDCGGDWTTEKGLNAAPLRTYEVQHEFDFEPTYVCPRNEAVDAGDHRSVILGKDIPQEARQVLAHAIAEFLSRSEDSR